MHERTDDVNAPQIVLIGVISVILTIVSILSAILIYRVSAATQVTRKVLAIPYAESDAVLAAQTKALGQYAWVDDKKQLVQIPIEDAKQRVLKQLAAAPAAEPASEKPAEKKGPAAADAKAAESK